MINSNVDGQAQWRSSLMDNYGTPASRWCAVTARGCGTPTARATSTSSPVLAVNALGHAHPAVVAAVTEQIGVLGHTSNLYVNPVAVELAEALLDVTGFAGQGKVLLLQLRRRGQRGRVQDEPADRPRPRWSPARARSTAAPWARSR